MRKGPLVSITIPTFNSERFIALCLRSTRKQGYKNIEINIVDGGSKDNTVEIAKKNGVKNIFINKKSLLSARLDGVKKSRGKYVLLLDSDQVLGMNTIQRSIKYMEKSKLKMLILGEDVYADKTFLEHLYKLDKKLVHKIKDINPYTSVLLPRFYRRDFLLKVFRVIPHDVIDQARPQDHAIIYLESWKLDKNIHLINNCIRHIEPNSMINFFKKFYRWGYYSNFEEPSKYQSFFNQRTMRLRKGIINSGMRKETIASILLLILKGVPYKIGNYTAKIQGSVNRNYLEK